MLTDTGPLVAIINPNENAHANCTAFLKTLRRPMITIWPCLTKAAHLLRKAGGLPCVLALWELYDKGVAQVHLPNAIEVQRVRDLMNTYRDIPCDLRTLRLSRRRKRLERIKSLRLTAIFTFTLNRTVRRLR